MVYRYQKLLREDEDLRAKMQFLRPVPRTIPMIAVGLGCFIPLMLAVFSGTGRFPLIIFGCVCLFSAGTQLVQELWIIRSWSSAVGTVFSWHRINLGRRSGAQIRYAFRTSNDRIYVGKTSGGLKLPGEGKTLGVLFRSENPERNLPISQFWFYGFSFGPGAVYPALTRPHTTTHR
jgi:hypothetical protein